MQQRQQRRARVMCATVITVTGIGMGARAADLPPSLASTVPTTRPASDSVDVAAGVVKMQDVVVTANRLPTDPSQVGSSVSTITADDIQRRQVYQVADALRLTPGIDVARSGGPNQITSVFMRGSDSSHTLVLIDGIPANDPSSPNRAFDFSRLTTDDVDRIEVLRGPQSTLWGSNALGGVINVITRRGEGKPSGYVYGEYGSFDTFREGAGISGSERNLNYSFSVTEIDSNGFSAADEKFGNREDDGFGNTSLAGKVGWNVSRTLDIDFVARYNRARTDIDDFGGPGGDDPFRTLVSNDAYFRIAPHLLLFDGLLEQTYGFNYTYYDRRDNDDAFPDDIHGGVGQFDFQNDLHLGEHHTVTAGLSVSEEDFASQSVSHRTQDAIGIYAQDAISFADRLYLTAGARYEDHSASESAWTYRFTGAYLFPSTGTKLKASYGTGYKAPSLSNLFSSFGSPDLRPEKVRGWDAGVEQSWLAGRVTAEAVYFRNDFDNLIDFDFVANRLENIGAARTQGVELGFTARPMDRLALGINYTYTDTLNTDTDQQLLRRAPHKIGAEASWQYSDRGNLTLAATYYSSRVDIDPITFGRSRLGGYTLLNLSTSYKVTDHATIIARVENLLDRDYEEVAGFGTAGISIYGGLRLTF